jgi:hypothetical protein
VISRALLAAAALALAGCGAQEPVDPAATPAAPHISPDGPVTLPLEDTAGLGLRGEVTLASAGAARTDVGVDLDAPGGVAFSASIREGSCDDPGEVVHDLGVVETGSASLAADAPLGGVLSRDRALVLTADEDGVVACADLPQRAG